MSEWSVPAGMTPQDNPGQPKDGIGALVKRVQDNAREMRERFNNLLGRAGIKAVVGGLRILGFLQSDDFDGDLDTGDAGTTGWAMNASRVAIGELFLRPGSLGNDMLAHPIAQDSDWGTTSNFPVTGTWTERASATIVVPAGFTRMQFYAIASVTARNDVGSTQYLMARIRSQVNGAGELYGGVEAMATVPNAYWATVLAPQNWGMAVVGGASWRFWVEVWTGGGTWSADPVHYARIEVAATFSR